MEGTTRTAATTSSSSNSQEPYRTQQQQQQQQQPPPPPRPEPVDRYGFYMDDDFRGSLKVTDQIMESRKKKESERSLKWAKMIKNWDQMVLTRHEKLKRRVRKGIPDATRGFAWFKLSGTVLNTLALTPILAMI